MKKLIVLSVVAFGLFLVSAGTAAAQTTSVAGSWDGSMNTPGGSVGVTFMFKVDGEKVTGTVKRASGELPLQGTIKGSDINFSYTVNYNGNDITLTFTGKVTGDTMNGNVSFGGQADDQWSAKRTPAAKPKTDQNAL